MTQNEFNESMKTLQDKQEFFNIQRKAEYNTLKKNYLQTEQEIETLRLRRSQLEARMIDHRSETKARNRDYRAAMAALVAANPELAEARRAEQMARREACRQAREEGQL